MRPLKSRFPWFATICTVIAIAVLCGLGTWQVKRLIWKQALLDNIQSEYEKDTRITRLDLRDLVRLKENRVKKGFIDGRFDYTKEIHVGPRQFDGGFGYDIYTPFTMNNGANILVNRGWVRTQKVLQSKRLETLVKGQMRLYGVARIPDKPWAIAAQNAPVKDLWIHADPLQVAKVKGIPNMVAPVFYMQDSSVNIPTLVQRSDDWKIANNHLQYSIFWFAMAGILGLIYWIRFWRD